MGIGNEKWPNFSENSSVSLYSMWFSSSAWKRQKFFSVRDNLLHQAWKIEFNNNSLKTISRHYLLIVVYPGNFHVVSIFHGGGSGLFQDFERLIVFVCQTHMEIGFQMVKPKFSNAISFKGPVTYSNAYRGKMIFTNFPALNISLKNRSIFRWRVSATWMFFLSIFLTIITISPSRKYNPVSRFSRFSPSCLREKLITSSSQIKAPSQFSERTFLDR